MHPSAHSLGYWLKAIHAHTWKYPKNVVRCVDGKSCFASIYQIKLVVGKRADGWSAVMSFCIFECIPDEIVFVGSCTLALKVAPIGSSRENCLTNSVPDSWFTRWTQKSIFNWCFDSRMNWATFLVSAAPHTEALNANNASTCHLSQIYLCCLRGSIDAIYSC